MAVFSLPALVTSCCPAVSLGPNAKPAALCSERRLCGCAGRAHIWAPHYGQGPWAGVLTSLVLG